MIACDTQQPYVHCLEVPSSSSSSGGRLDVRVKGIWFEHFSKSVANNYCIVAQVRHGWLRSRCFGSHISLRGECQPGFLPTGASGGSAAALNPTPPLAGLGPVTQQPHTAQLLLCRQAASHWSSATSHHAVVWG